MLRLDRRGRALGAVVAATVATAAAASAVAQEDVGPTPVAPALEPAIAELEADWVRGQIRLRTQVIPRGAKVTHVFFRYRGKRFRAAHVRRWDHAKRVEARGGDGRGDVIRFKVRACTESRCVTRSGSDRATRPS